MFLSTMLVAAALSIPCNPAKQGEPALQREGRVPVDPSRTTQLYDVRDLLEPRLDLSGASDEVRAMEQAIDADEVHRQLEEQRRIRDDLKDQGLSRRFGAPDRATADTFRRERLLRAETQDVAAFLAKLVEPPLRGTAGKLDVAGPGTLTFTASPEQHDWLGGLLERHRSATAAMVDVSARFVRAPAGTLASLGISSGAIAETPGELAELETKLGDPRFEKVIAPRVRVFLLSRSEIRVEDEVAYVEDWEFTTVEPGHQRIADPRIGRVSEGHALAVRAALLEPGLYALAAEFERSEIVRPIRTAKVVEPESGRELEVALPEVNRARIVSDLKLRDGAAAVLIHRTSAEQELGILVRIESARETGAQHRR